MKNSSIKKYIGPFKSVGSYLLAAFLANTAFLSVFWRGSFASFDTFWKSTIWGMTIWITQSVGHGMIFTELDKRYSWIEQPVKRFVLAILGIVLYAVFAFAIVQIVMHSIFIGDIPDNFFQWLWNNSRMVIIISFVVALFLSAIGFLNSWRKAKTEADELRLEVMKYKYESLRRQINPHFLFNSFNVLSELIHEDPQLADRFVNKMSSLFQYVVSNSEKELISLEEELAFAEDYFFLHKIRFDKKIKMNIDCHFAESEHLVPLSLQLLIENAVKHNEISKAKPLTRSIRRNGANVIIENNLQALASARPGTETGLRTIRNSYKQFTDREILVQQNGTFRVSLPIIQMETP